MNHYHHFGIAIYMHAYYAAETDDAKLREDMEKYLEYLPLDKVYVENHRGLVDVPVKRLKELKAILEKYGVKVSGGITSTGLVNGVPKPALFDTFCYTDPDHRREYLRIVSEAAEVFDEIILDDYFFTSCRCEMCISAKGSRSWKDFRQAQMLEFSSQIVSLAKKVNPDINFIIKYPNWYESYQATGYNPGLQKDVFDMVYTGTETREPFYMAQHLQRYESYGAVRLLTNAAPGRNGGGWIDPHGSSDNLNRFLEQAEFTLLGGAKELTLFNFPVMLTTPALPALDYVLRRTDAFLDRASRPAGTAVWVPFDAEGEDQLCSYLGMCGAALELTPDFPDDAPAVLLTQRSACRPDSVARLEEYVRKGGTAIITTGFLKAAYDRGIQDMTSVRLTGRHVMGSSFMIGLADYDYADDILAQGYAKILFEALDYKTNATWPDVLMLAGENNFPVLTEDLYGRGRLFVLNVPENFADLYKLPAEVIGTLCKVLSAGMPVYLRADPKWSLICYDNETFCLHSFRPMISHAQVVVRGECSGIEDVETGTIYKDGRRLPSPRRKDDAASTRAALPEYAFDIAVEPGRSMYLRVIRSR
ncbi:MAG TPA: hypothetical protein DDX51_07275 [Clostridiales bacterium]|nr:hypothetical protein [Clostridiales bacterium]